MIGDLFTFRGRLGRLGYLGRGLLLLVLVVVGWAVGIALGVTVLAGGARGAGPGALLLVVLLLVGLWGAALIGGLALMSRRARDVGLPVVPAVAGLVALAVIDALASHRAGWPGWRPTNPAGLALLLGWLVLLLCPGGAFGAARGKRTAGEAPVPDAPAAPDAPRAAPPPWRAPRPAAGPEFPRGGGEPRGGFGRRGLLG